MTQNVATQGRWLACWASTAARAAQAGVRPRPAAAGRQGAGRPPAAVGGRAGSQRAAGGSRPAGCRAPAAGRHRRRWEARPPLRRRLPAGGQGRNARLGCLLAIAVGVGPTTRAAAGPRALHPPTLHHPPAAPTRRVLWLRLWLVGGPVECRDQKDQEPQRKRGPGQPPHRCGACAGEGREGGTGRKDGTGKGAAVSRAHAHDQAGSTQAASHRGGRTAWTPGWAWVCWLAARRLRCPHPCLHGQGRMRRPTGSQAEGPGGGERQ